MQSDDSQPIEQLLVMLKDQDWTVRMKAAVELGTVKDQRVVEPLISALEDSDPDVRRFAAQALGDIKDPRAVKPLIATLRGKNPGDRLSAAEALRNIKDPQAVGPLIAALRDADSTVRHSAAQALGDIKDLRAVEPLIATLRDQDRRVLVAAAEALADIKDPRAVPGLLAAGATTALTRLGKLATEQLTAALKDGSWSNRLTAASALGGIQAVRAVEPLVDKLSDPILLVRQAAARALEAMAWAPSTPSEQLNWMLVTQQWDGLAKTGIPAIDPLIAALRDVSDSDERRKVVEALAEIDSQTQAFTAIGLRIRQGPVAPGFVARLFGLNRTSVVRETQVQAVREMVHFLVAKRDGSSLKRITPVRLKIE